jgi:hypothetical protein
VKVIKAVKAVKQLQCVAAARLLQAYHDRELAVSDQIAVAGHVAACARCSATLDEIRSVGSMLSSLSTGRRVLTGDASAAFNQAVVSRLKAEDNASLLAYVRDMFDDIRLVYAGLGAAAATVACVVIMLGMMRFATNERPDSLAAIVTLVATPLECETIDVSDTAGCRARWEARFKSANESAEQESVFALDEVVTHQSGHLANLEVLRTGRRAAAGRARTIETLLDAVTRLRLEGKPTLTVAVPGSVVWLVERATVRASIKPPVLETVAPPPLKKRAETNPLNPRVVRA